MSDTGCEPLLVSSVLNLDSVVGCLELSSYSAESARPRRHHGQRGRQCPDVGFFSLYKPWYLAAAGDILLGGRVGGRADWDRGGGDASVGEVSFFLVSTWSRRTWEGWPGWG